MNETLWRVAVVGPFPPPPPELRHGRMTVRNLPWKGGLSFMGGEYDLVIASARISLAQADIILREAKRAGIPFLQGVRTWRTAAYRSRNIGAGWLHEMYELKPPTMGDQLLAALREHGPLTVAELRALIKRDRTNAAGSVLSRMAKAKNPRVELLEDGRYRALPAPEPDPEPASGPDPESDSDSIRQPEPDVLAIGPDDVRARLVEAMRERGHGLTLTEMRHVLGWTRANVGRAGMRRASSRLRQLLDSRLSPFRREVADAATIARVREQTTKTPTFVYELDEPEPSPSPAVNLAHILEALDGMEIVIRIRRRRP